MQRMNFLKYFTLWVERLFRFSSKNKVKSKQCEVVSKSSMESPVEDDIAQKVSTFEVGQLFNVPDSDWKNNFAKNKREEGGVHPGLIKVKNKDNYSYSIIPGTSSPQMGSCVFRTQIQTKKDSHFLLKFSMPIVDDQLASYRLGWGSRKSLDENQIKDLSFQHKLCYGFSGGLK